MLLGYPKEREIAGIFDRSCISVLPASHPCCLTSLSCTRMLVSLGVRKALFTGLVFRPLETLSSLKVMRRGV